MESEQSRSGPRPKEPAPKMPSKESDFTCDWAKQILREWFVKNEKNPNEISIRNVEAKLNSQQGLLSTTFIVHVHYQQGKDGEEEVKHLFVKIPLKGEAGDPYRQVNVREHEMYTNVLPSLSKFLQDHCTGFFRMGVPEVIYTYYIADQEHDAVVIEDLTAEGFVTCVTSDLEAGKGGKDYLRSTLETLSQLHGTGLSFREYIGGSKEILKRFHKIEEQMQIKDILEDKQQRIFLRTHFSPFIRYLEESDPELKGITQYMRKMETYLMKILQVLEESGVSSLNTLCHGDAKPNNFMFRKIELDFDDEDFADLACEGVESMLIDWQGSFLGSLCNDLMWCVYPFLEVNSHDKDLYEFVFVHYHQELKNVLETFGKTLQDFNLPESLPEFRSVIRRGFVLEFLIVTILRPVMQVSNPQVIRTWYKQLQKHEKLKEKGGIYKVLAGKPPKLPAQDQVFQNPRYMEFLQFYFKVATSLGAFQELGLVYFELMKDAMFEESKYDDFASDIKKKPKVFSKEWFKTVFFGPCTKPQTGDKEEYAEQDENTPPVEKKVDPMVKEDMIYADQDLPNMSDKTPDEVVYESVKPIAVNNLIEEDEKSESSREVREPTPPDPLRKLAAELHASFVDYRETFTGFKDLLDRNAPELLENNFPEDAEAQDGSATSFEHNLLSINQTLSTGKADDVSNNVLEGDMASKTQPGVDEDLEKEGKHQITENILDKNVVIAKNIFLQESVSVERKDCKTEEMTRVQSEDNGISKTSSSYSEVKTETSKMNSTTVESSSSTYQEETTSSEILYSKVKKVKHESTKQVEKKECLPVESNFQEYKGINLDTPLTLRKITKEVNYSGLRVQEAIDFLSSPTIEPRASVSKSSFSNEMQKNPTQDDRKESFCSDLSREELIDILDMDEAAWAEDCSNEKQAKDVENIEVRDFKTDDPNDGKEIKYTNSTDDQEQKRLEQDKSPKEEYPKLECKDSSTENSSSNKNSILAWLQLAAAKPSPEAVDSQEEMRQSPPKSLFELLQENEETNDVAEEKTLVKEENTGKVEEMPEKLKENYSAIDYFHSEVQLSENLVLSPDNSEGDNVQTQSNLSSGSQQENLSQNTIDSQSISISGLAKETSPIPLDRVAEITCEESSDEKNQQPVIQHLLQDVISSESNLMLKNTILEANKIPTKIEEDIIDKRSPSLEKSVAKIPSTVARSEVKVIEDDSTISCSVDSGVVEQKMINCSSSISGECSDNGNLKSHIIASAEISLKQKECVTQEISTFTTNTCEFFSSKIDELHNSSKDKNTLIMTSRTDCRELDLKEQIEITKQLEIHNGEDQEVVKVLNTETSECDKNIFNSTAALPNFVEHNIADLIDQKIPQEQDEYSSRKIEDKLRHQDGEQLQNSPKENCLIETKSNEDFGSNIKTDKLPKMESTNDVDDNLNELVQEFNGNYDIVTTSKNIIDAGIESRTVTDQTFVTTIDESQPKQTNCISLTQSRFEDRVRNEMTRCQKTETNDLPDLIENGMADEMESKAGLTCPQLREKRSSFSNSNQRSSIEIFDMIIEDIDHSDSLRELHSESFSANNHAAERVTSIEKISLNGDSSISGKLDGTTENDVSSVQSIEGALISGCDENVKPVNSERLQIDNGSLQEVDDLINPRMNSSENHASGPKFEKKAFEMEENQEGGQGKTPQFDDGDKFEPKKERKTDNILSCNSDLNMCLDREKENESDVCKDSMAYESVNGECLDQIAEAEQEGASSGEMNNGSDQEQVGSKNGYKSGEETTAGQSSTNSMRRRKKNKQNKKRRRSKIYNF